MSAPLPRPGVRPAFHIPTRPAPADDQWAAWLAPAGIPAPLIDDDATLRAQWRNQHTTRARRDTEVRQLP